tara:strand:- start:140 stop:346 length:207 start_codon:yes stop_codon:yes gene_type:complete
METRKKTTESEWSKFVSSFEDYVTPNPYNEIDEMYLTPAERLHLYDQATSELKAKIQVLRDKKKKKEK